MTGPLPVQIQPCDTRYWDLCRIVSILKWLYIMSETLQIMIFLDISPIIKYTV